MPDGHYRYSPGSDQTPIWVTSQALMAVEREAFPVEPVPRTSDPGGLPPPVGGGGEAGSGAPGSGDGRGDAGEKKPGSDHKAKRERKREDAAPAGGGPEVEGTLARAEAPAAGATDGGEDAGGDLTAYALGGLGALAAGSGGGFLWYRRRLP